MGQWITDSRVSGAVVLTASSRTVHLVLASSRSAVVLTASSTVIKQTWEKRELDL